MSGSDARALSRSLLDLCRMRKLTIATAESCTGGLVAGALTDIPGSSDVIDRGFVTYSNDAKRAMLGVKATTLATFGAVSKETATAMAVGALEEGRGRSCRLHYRHRRPGRRHARQTGRPRAFRRCRPRRQDPASRMPVRRDRPQYGAPAIGGGGAPHADGTGAWAATAGQAAPRSRKPPAPARRAHAAARRRQAAALAAGVMRASPRHCQERRDEQSTLVFARRWIASRSLSSGALRATRWLAMTVEISHDEAMPSLP